MAQTSSTSVRQRAAAVLRVLRGEDAVAVARHVGVPADVLTEWRDLFVQGGRHALAAETPADRVVASASVDASPGLMPDEDPLLDWAVEQERLGAMVLRVGELVLQQRAARRG